MKKLLFIALLAVAVAATPAFASVQNIKISGDIDSTFLVRDQFDLGLAENEGTAQNLLMTQTRLRIDADLTENVSAVVALINERVWGAENDDADDTDIDLNLAYVTLREMLYSPLTVVVGRQNFSYGNSFVVSSAGPNHSTSGDNGLSTVAGDLTKRSAMDAIRMILDYNPLTIEVLAAKVDANVNTGLEPEDDDVNLYGVNSTYQLGDDWDSVVESYFFAKIDSNETLTITGTADGHKADTVYTYGFRGSTNPIKGLNSQIECALQFGNKASTATALTTRRVDNRDRNAWALQLINSYILPFEKTAEYNPVVSSSYTYYSGDKDPTLAGGSRDNYNAWDPMYEDQSGGTIYNSLLTSTNCHVASVSGQLNPIEDVTFKTTWTGLWLARKIDPDATGMGSGSNWLLLLQPNGTPINPTLTSNTGIGYEIDFDLLYDYTEDVQLGFKMGWFFPGTMFDGTNDDTAKQFLANVNVNF